MDRAFDELVDARVIRDQPHSLSVRLGQEEGRLAPYGGLVDPGDDPFVDEVLEYLFCLLFEG